MGSTRNMQNCSKYDRTNDMIFWEYKRYKKKNPAPDYKDVIDFTNMRSHEHLVCKISLTHNHVIDESCCKVGLKHPKDWEVFEVKSSPGFIVVNNPFINNGAQSFWVKQALTEYTRKPYPCNLDALMELDKEKTIWEIAKDHEEPKFINQLRWVHMGYHFDYNVVDYKEKQYFGFPEDLACLTKTIAKLFQFENYIAETGIINYYPEGSSMGGHTDHYEEALTQPLISYSFGQSAIYLIGGQTRDVKPAAIWVRSGDIMLMTGPSRTAFHAVPIIITKPQKTGPEDLGRCPLVLREKPEADTEEIAQKNCCCKTPEEEHVWKNEMTNKESWKCFSDYLKSTRVNINIRQVHKYSPPDT